MELLAGGVSVLDLMQKTPDQLQEQGGWIISDACLASFRNWLAGFRQVPCSQTQADALQSLPSSVLGPIASNFKVEYSNYRCFGIRFRFMS